MELVCNAECRVGENRNGGAARTARHEAIMLQQRNLLDERREPVHKCESFTSIAICRPTAQDLHAVLLVESQPDVRHQPTELDNDERDLETDYAHDS